MPEDSTTRLSFIRFTNVCALTLWLLNMIEPVSADITSFFYMKSVDRCGESRCQQADYFHYYGCTANGCDFHLQPWVFTLVSFIVLSFLFSLVCSLLSCICCRDRPRHRYP
ncbi:hypothetical protein DdX_09487 [Ditylenchus destructor]|uniref:Uncharacterized protein n=1 Tax=Ditylenchus destructor TaxID=166010 RepID=A0AAD4N213_9BILA|nr:hypothetical protein DdX_09487 [Ditylenchus destructor]